MSERTFAPCEHCGAMNRFGDVPDKAPVCGKCKQPLPYHDGVVDVDAKGLEKLIEKSSIPVVVDFWAAWCGPCQYFAPIYQSVARERFGRAVFAKVDTERAAEAGGRYNITAIPTLVVFKGGREVHRQSGALPEPALRQLVDSLG